MMGEKDPALVWYALEATRGALFGSMIFFVFMLFNVSKKHHQRNRYVVIAIPAFLWGFSIVPMAAFGLGRSIDTVRDLWAARAPWYMVAVVWFIVAPLLLLALAIWVHRKPAPVAYRRKGWPVSTDDVRRWRATRRRDLRQGPRFWWRYRAPRP